MIGPGRLAATVDRRTLSGEVMGQGKKLFENGAIPAAFTLIESLVTPSGVIIANFKRAGEVKTGSF